ncbi:MAG: hypothetical protein O2955_14125 [Planctomycetota bacterium]|nr:hypothetical protein [Planctomycetota bacterium]
MKVNGWNIVILVLCTSALTSFILMGFIKGHVPLVIGLAATGTILGRLGVANVDFPRTGGLVGGVIATLIEFQLQPILRVVGIFVWIENLVFALIVSAVVLGWLNLLTPGYSREY